MTFSTVISSLAKVAETKEESAWLVLADSKGKVAIDTDETNKGIEENVSMGEGPFHREFGGRRYRVHHSTIK